MIGDDDSSRPSPGYFGGDDMGRASILCCVTFWLVFGGRAEADFATLNIGGNPAEASLGLKQA
jgi:hypothetical protein